MYYTPTGISFSSAGFFWNTTQHTHTHNTVIKNKNLNNLNFIHSFMYRSYDNNKNVLMMIFVLYFSIENDLEKKVNDNYCCFFFHLHFFWFLFNCICMLEQTNKQTPLTHLTHTSYRKTFSHLIQQR